MPIVVGLVALTLIPGLSFAQDSRIINPVVSHGAKGDGKAIVPLPSSSGGPTIPGCSMAAGSATLTCPARSFTSADAGKVIAVYGAGRALTDKNGRPIVQPLSSTIARVVDDAHVTLADSAASTLASSERVVWGTNDTQALQNAIDALAARGGGTLEIPSGLYLTTGLSMPCGAVGTFMYVGPCPRAYNNLEIRGAGAGATTLENWQIAGGAATLDAVISIGRNAKDNFYRDGNQLVSNLTISDLAIRQVKHASEPRFMLIGRASTNVVLRRIYGTGWSYEGIVVGGDSTRWQILDSELEGCGRGGPANSGPGCLNPGSSMSRVARNTIRGAGACFEAGGYLNVYEDNQCSGQQLFDATGVNAYCFFIGSSVTGIYDLTMQRNTCVHANIGVSNVLGTLNRIRIIGNQFRDSTIVFLQGQESNSAPLACCPDTVVHGQSVIASNVFLYSRENPIQSFPIRVGGVETVLVKDNTVTWATAFGQAGADSGKPCQSAADVPNATRGCHVANAFLSVTDYGGGRTWEAGKAYPAGTYVIPIASNGHFYVATTAGTSASTAPVWPVTIDATIRDGNVVWRNLGPLPRLLVEGNTVNVPVGATGTGTEIALYGTTNPATVTIVNQVMSFPWSIQCANAGFAPSGCHGGNIGPIPAFVPYSFMYTPRPTCGAGCASIAGTDRIGTITTSAGNVTSVTLNFGSAMPAAPACVASTDRAGVGGASLTAVSPTSATFSTTASIGGGRITYRCDTP